MGRHNAVGNSRNKDLVWLERYQKQRLERKDCMVEQARVSWESIFVRQPRPRLERSIAKSLDVDGEVGLDSLLQYLHTFVCCMDRGRHRTWVDRLLCHLLHKPLRESNHAVVGGSAW